MNRKNTEQAEKLLRNGSAKLGVVLTEPVLSQLLLYARELLKWNQKVNLVARNTSVEDLIEKHFLDSLTLLPVLAKASPANGLLLDIGSGAGFPGLVVKIACPKRPVTLLEPRQRRVSFLNHIIRKLGLSDIKVIPHRTDEKDMLPDLEYQVITGRAVADVHSFLEMAEGLACPGSLVICMQGGSGLEQWEREKSNPLFNGIGLEEILLPYSGAHRCILMFEKK